MPKHSTLAAYAALFISLGGTGYAATELAPNSVGTAQIRNGSVQSRDLARGVFSKHNAKLASTITDVITDPASGLQINVNATDGKDGANGAPGPIGPIGPQGDPSKVPGPQGVQGVTGDKGDTGAQGPAGTGVGSGAATATGCYPTACDLNQISYTHPSTGAYCFTTNKTTVGNGDAATVTPADDASGVSYYVVKSPPTGVCSGKDWGVFFNVDHAFFIIVA